MTLRTILAAVVLSAASSMAWADGMPTTASPVGQSCYGNNFAGAYIGAAVGVGWHESHVDNVTLGIPVGSEDRGGMFGGYVGYNFQRCDRYVLGIEADLSYLDASARGTEVEYGPTGLTETTTLTSRMDFIGTLRARAGITIHDHILLYGTAGLAYAKLDQILSNDCVGCGNSVFNLGPFWQSDTENKFGWTVGGGIEVAHNSRWLFRAEALYMDLGSNDRTYVIDTPIATAVSTNRWDDQFWVARLGLTYRFGEREEVVPLK
jgi:outer membrane immunogenic protein